MPESKRDKVYQTISAELAKGHQAFIVYPLVEESETLDLKDATNMSKHLQKDLLQRLSGVATITRQFVRAVAGTSAKIVDTRKTTPGLRALEKYAVLAGGGNNHRKDLGEAVLIKENHIRLAGGVAQALAAVQPAKGRAKWIEIEVTNLDELRAALAYHPDIVLLDNMSPSLVRQAVERVRLHDPARNIRTEASGGINLGNVRDFAEAGVDWISVGALTHSAPAMDLSFEVEPE